jgi:hypothetical protein
VISVIIPVDNEAKALRRILEHLFLQEGEYEVLAVDGGSADATGDWLLFLHADTLLPAGALARLNAWEANTDIQAGVVRHRFSGDRWSPRFVLWLPISVQGSPGFAPVREGTRPRREGNTSRRVAASRFQAETAAALAVADENAAASGAVRV